ncbi:phosphoglycolate phosphatase [Halalkaliarchaeum desulfuricum]|uniref:Phosphoglycolate phosphatase n=1 Tax=Halalkaliarchaeum desulfuricum TaxID=2055893 RepID=A0A343TGY7_9EURY|nr:HAD-IIB family hydrolase [Halalkaliarchaeum desulfuricum]AUX08359.1 phosphoglycolate phosphatase [Halalkaliarchaeum desulfuricum]
MAVPLALDIDGTLTTPTGRLDHRVFELLPGWDAPVVLATGKAFPYPIALCHFLGLPERIIAENGGVVHVDGETTLRGDREAAWGALETYADRDGTLEWGAESTVNRWRETEVALSLSADEALLREVADEFGLVVVDTGFAYHLKSPGPTKGEGLSVIADRLGIPAESFVAIGDSENDVSTFELVAESYAVGNADEAARRAADTVVSEEYMDGTAALLRELRQREH